MCRLQSKQRPAGIEAQRATAHAYAERKGLGIVGEFCDEGISAKSLSGRPCALAALVAVRDRKGAGLLVAKMDRLSRSVVDGAGLMEAARLKAGRYFLPISISTRARRLERWQLTSSSPVRSTSAR